MDRREALKSLGTAMSLPVLQQLGWAEALAVGREVHAALQTEGEESLYIFKTLDPHQDQMVSTIAEIIIPETDTPGAKAARVNEFIDLVLTDWFTADESERFLVGLGELDQLARETVGKRFVDCEETQQIELLKKIEAEALAAQEKGVRIRLAPAEHSHFFLAMKSLTLIGYYTSEVGMTKELEWEVFPVSYDGCTNFDRG
jgi:hypothetical protein